jgi:hypothetical protein
VTEQQGFGLAVSFWGAVGWAVLLREAGIYISGGITDGGGKLYGGAYEA